MNRSIFQASPFRSSYGLQPVRQTVMGGWLDDLTTEITGEDVGGLLADMDSLIAKLPVDAAGNYGKKRDDCLAKPTIAQYKCLYDLFQEIKNHKDSAAPPVTPPAVKPAATSLPIVPIAIGAVALAGVLYFAFGRN
jgi:hypothetical protein